MKSKSKTISKLKSRFTYLTLFLILFGGFVVRLYKIDNPVADWHSWRQTDTASVSMMYVKDGVDLLYPRYHDLSSAQSGYANPEGYRFVEFPLFNYFHANLYNLVPIVPFDMVGRLVSIVAGMTTAYFLYLIGRKLHGPSLGLLSAFFYAFLPFNIFFTRVILPDPLAVTLSVVSVFFFLRYSHGKKLYDLLASSAIFSIALLVKPHSIFFALPIAFLAIKEWGIMGLLRNKWFFVALNIVFAPILLWRIWMYQPGLLRGIPFWEWAFNGTGIRFRPAYWRWIYVERLGFLILGVWGLFPFVYGIAKTAKKIWPIHMFGLGAVLYVTVFASANIMHDYYQIFIIPAVALVLAWGTYSIWTSRELNPVVAKLGVTFCVLMMFAVGAYNVKDNYRINDTRIVKAGNIADKLLPEDAKVIATYGGDTTFLYQTRRSGWPIVTTSINKLIEQGADYYISVDFDNQDTINFSERFESVYKTDEFVILDLHREKGQL